MKKITQKSEAQDAEISKIEDAQVMQIMSKAPLNLDETIKVLDRLWQKQKQRAALIVTVDSLNDFEFKRKEEEVDDNANYYTGCELTIKDDERRSFNTKNPILIRGVVEFLKHRCQERLMEVEAEIILPE
jgi:hypothetical protein